MFVGIFINVEDLSSDNFSAADGLPIQASPFFYDNNPIFFVRINKKELPSTQAREGASNGHVHGR